MENNLDRLKKIIADKFGVPTDLITKDSVLTSDLNLDHLEISDLLSIVIREFELSIRGEELGPINSLQDILNLIDSFSEEL